MHQQHMNLRILGVLAALFAASNALSTEMDLLAASTGYLDGAAVPAIRRHRYVQAMRSK